MRAKNFLGRAHKKKRTRDQKGASFLTKKPNFRFFSFGVWKKRTRAQTQRKGQIILLKKALLYMVVKITTTPTKPGGGGRCKKTKSPFLMIA